MSHGRANLLRSAHLAKETSPSAEHREQIWALRMAASMANTHQNLGSADSRLSDADDEEEELARLRSSAGYAKYAGKYGREEATTLRRTREAAVRRDNDDAAEPSLDRASNPALNDDGRDSTSIGANEKPMSEAHRDIAPVVRRRPRRQIDPKIIDDSSDDDEASEEENNADDDDGPLGPALPPGVSFPNSAAIGKSSTTAKPAASRPSVELPCSHRVRLGTTHESFVSSVSLDAAGVRFASASADSTVRLWDFGTMTKRLESFRSSEPLGSGPITSARFSSKGGHILCAGSLPFARVLDRDARPQVESAPGDMYIVDMARTKGHVARLIDARWTSTNANAFVSIGADATFRLWDVAAATAPASVFDGDLPRAKQTKVIKLRNARGSKATPSAMCVLGVDPTSPSCGKRTTAIACDDSSIKVIDPDEFSMRPAAETAKACTPGSFITGLEFTGYDGLVPGLLLARGSDDSLRVFDVRRLDDAIASFKDLPNATDQTGVCVGGAGGTWFATGTSAPRRPNAPPAALYAYDARTLQQVWKGEAADGAGSVVAMTWQPRVNQILYGCADGSIHVLYSPESSSGGVLNCIDRAERRKQHGVVALGLGEAYTPDAVPTRGRSSQANNGNTASTAGTNTRGTKRSAPGAALPAPSSSEDVGKPSSSLTATFMKSKLKKSWADEDPREALVRRDAETKANPVFTAAYQRTQPTNILAEKTAEQEEAERAEARQASKADVQGVGRRADR